MFQGYVSCHHEDDKMIVFERGSLLWVFNFHSTKSFADYRVGASIAGKYPLSQHEKFGFTLSFTFFSFSFIFLSCVLKDKFGTVFVKLNSLTGRHNRVCGLDNSSFSVPKLTISQAERLYSPDVWRYEVTHLIWPNLGRVNTLWYLDSSLRWCIRFVWSRHDYFSSKYKSGLTNSPDVKAKPNNSQRFLPFCYSTYLSI